LGSLRDPDSYRGIWSVFAALREIAGFVNAGVKTTCSNGFEKSEAQKAFEGRPDFFSLSANGFLCGLCVNVDLVGLCGFA